MSRKTNMLLVLGGAATAGAAAYLAFRRSTKTTEDVQKAIEGISEVTTPPTPPEERGLVKLRLTGYWPYSAREDERQMEGGVTDRKGKPLYTLEQHKADPARYPYVSLAGDYALWPYGQRVVIPELGENLVFRVVDTGGHFHGASKLYRMVGAEPVDVCVNSSKTKLPTSVTARIIPGDNFEKGKSVASAGFKDQTVVVGEGRTVEDVEALARAVTSELGACSDEEQQAAAWAMRNRADVLGATLKQLLAPLGFFGPSAASKGYASTRRQADKRAVTNVIGCLDALQSKDPTGGATEFWVPKLQQQMHMLGCLHRGAVANGDNERAQRYARFAGYETEDAVRDKYQRSGFSVVGVVGDIELLGRKS
jgi:hypothetical protein